MLDEGVNVILSEDMKNRLFLSNENGHNSFHKEQDPVAAEEIKTLGDEIAERKIRDPTYGMTAAERDRYKKNLMNKPRPRELFDVKGLIIRRNDKILKRKEKYLAEKERIRQEKKQKEEIKSLKQDIS